MASEQFQRMNDPKVSFRARLRTLCGYRGIDTRRGVVFRQLASGAWCVTVHEVEGVGARSYTAAGLDDAFALACGDERNDPNPDDNLDGEMAYKYELAYGSDGKTYKVPGRAKVGHVGKQGDVPAVEPVAWTSAGNIDGVQAQPKTAWSMWGLPNGLINVPLYTSPPLTREGEGSAEVIEKEIASVVQSVNEWDDRTSPDDYPDHLLITSDELADILRNFSAALAATRSGSAPSSSGGDNG